MKLKMPELEIGIRIQRKDGTVEEYSEPGHSWTRNAWNCAFSCITDAPGDGTSTYGAGYMNARRTDGFTTSGTTSTYHRGGAGTNAGFSPTAGQVVCGIRVGSGDAAFDIDATSLDAEILNGTSAGRLEHAAFEYPDVSISSTQFTALLTRQFTNSSGGDVSIREIALYNYSRFYSSTLRTYMFARDLLAGAIVLENTEILEVMYRIRLNVSGMGADGWTRNAWNFVFASLCDCTGDDEGLFGAGYMSSRRVAGDIYSSPTSFAYRGTQAIDSGGFGVAAAGIHAGTGDTAFSVNDYALASVIGSGTGAGQLTYGANSATATAYSSKKWTATISRTFTNGSGADITIKEIGLYWQGGLFSTATQFLFYRKVLDSTVTITNGSSHTFNIEITKDFGEID